MAYCAMNGIEVKIPERALRPREPAPPPPSVTMASKQVALRMLRPRTKAEKALTGVDVRAALARVRSLKAQQRGYEKRLKVLVEKLRKLAASGLGAVTVGPGYAYSSVPATVSATEQRVALQKEIDRLIECIKKLSAEANQLAMDAIKGGASQTDVRAAAGEGAAPERTPVSAPPAAPVIETRTPAVLPDGSVVPGPDAKLTTPDTGKPVTPEKEGKVEAQSAGGMHPLVILAAIGGGLWAYNKYVRRA